MSDTPPVSFDPGLAAAEVAARLLAPMERLIKDWTEVPLGTTGSLQVGDKAYLHPAQVELLKEKVAKAIVRARGPAGAPAECHKCAATFTSYKARREHLRGHLGEK